MTKLSNGIEIPDPIIFSATANADKKRKSTLVFVTRTSLRSFTITTVPIYMFATRPRMKAKDNYFWGGMIRALKDLGIDTEPSVIHRDYDLPLTITRTQREPAHGIGKATILSEKLGDETIVSLSTSELTGRVSEHLYRRVETLEGVHWDHTKTIGFADGNQAAKHYFDAGWELMEKTVTDTWRKLEEI